MQFFIFRLDLIEWGMGQSIHACSAKQLFGIQVVSKRARIGFCCRFHARQMPTVVRCFT